MDGAFTGSVRNQGYGNYPIRYLITVSFEEYPSPMIFHENQQRNSHIFLYYQLLFKHE